MGQLCPMKEMDHCRFPLFITQIISVVVTQQTIAQMKGFEELIKNISAFLTTSRPKLRNLKNYESAIRRMKFNFNKISAFKPEDVGKSA